MSEDFKVGFEKVAGFFDPDKKVEVIKDGKVKKMTIRDIARQAYKKVHGKDPEEKTAEFVPKPGYGKENNRMLAFYYKSDPKKFKKLKASAEAYAAHNKAYKK